MLREVPELPPKVSGQQPWELRPPCVRLQEDGSSPREEAISSLGSPASLLPGALARALEEHAACCRCVQWGKLLERWVGGGQGSQRGLVASCSGCYIPQRKAAVLGEAKVEQRTRQKLSRDHQEEAQTETHGSAPGTGPGRMDQRPPPPPIPGLRASRVHTTLIWDSFQQDTEGHDFSPCSHQD